MTRPMAELPVIIAQGGVLHGQRWGIAGEIRIGRDPECEIVIPDRQVSRVHARLSLCEKGTCLEDLGSKNGTFLNGLPVSQPVIIHDGDMIQIAVVQDFFYLSSDATLPLDQPIPSRAYPNESDQPGITLDAQSRRVWVGGEEIVPPLSGPQFRLLQVLYEQEGKVVSRTELVSAIWEEDKALGVSEQALDALVRRLRERLNVINNQTEFLVTVRGHGIRLENH